MNRHLSTVAVILGALILFPALALGQASILNVTSPLPNGQYAFGNTIAIQVQFDEAVTVTGKPRFQLETGNVDRFARYSTGTGTATLTFNYIVLDGDISNDLAYTSTAIDLVGGTIAALSDAQAADLTLPVSGGAGSLSANKDISVSGATGQTIDLNAWTTEGGSAQDNWQVAANGQAVTQTGQVVDIPSFFVSDTNLDGNSFEGQFTPSSDDDFMGIVFGFQSTSSSPTGTTGTTPSSFNLYDGQFYVFDWKRNPEKFGPYQVNGAPYGTGTAPEGARLLKVDGQYSEASMWTGMGDDVVSLASVSSPLYEPSKAYRFRLTFDPGLIRVEVFRVLGNVKLIDLSSTDSTFTSGKVGFYNYAFPGVTYSALTSAVEPPPMTPTGAKQGQALDVVFTGSGFTSQTLADFGSSDVIVTSMTFLNDNVVVAAVQVAPDAVLGPRTVTLTTGANAVTVAQPFAIASSNTNGLSIASVTPNRLLPSGTYNVVITGDNFASDSILTMGADVQVLSYSVLSDSQIAATARPLASTTGGTRFVTVQSASVGTAQFSYEVGGITSFNQTQTIAGNSGTATVQGFAFTPGVTIDIGPLVTIDAVDVISSQLLTFDYTIAPVAACGDLDVAISDGNGTIVALEVFTVDESDSGPPLPPGSVNCKTRLYGGSAYISCNDTANWANAKAACTAWGGYLLNLGSAAEDSELRAEYNGQRWTGYNDISVEGTFAWDDGAANAYTNWCANQPNDGGGAGADCVVFNLGGCWDDVACATTNVPFVCEKDPSVLPQGDVMPQILPAVIGSGSTVDITLRGFTPVCTGSTATFGSGITVNSCTVPNANDLVCNVTVSPSAVSGTRDVVVTSSVLGANVSISKALTVFRVNSVSPLSIAQGQTLNFDIFGSGFVSGAAVTTEAGGLTINSTQLIGPNQLRFNATASGTAQLGAYDLFVTNGGSSPAVLANAVTVTTAGGTTPPPTVSNILPDKGSPATNVFVRLFGQNFTIDATVDFGAGITVVDCDTITFQEIDCDISIHAGATLGGRDVTVTTAYGAVTVTNGFTVSTFTLVALTPNSVEVGETTDIIVSGFGFTNGLTINFGANITQNSLVVNSETNAIANITVGLNAVPGPRNVTAFVDGDASTLPGGLTVLLDPPSIVSVSPSIVVPGSAQTLTVSGANFVPTSVFVASAGVLGAPVFIDGNTMETSYTAPATAQLVDLSVTTTGGQDTLPGAITVYGLSAVTPVSIQQGTSGAISLIGVGFDGNEVFSFGTGISVDANNQTGNSANPDVTVAANAPLGPYPTTVTNAGLGVQHTFPLGITVLPPGTWTPPDPNVPAGCIAYEYQFRPYALCPTADSWANAQSDCASVGMTLVTVSHAAENAFVFGLLGDNNLDDAWIGLSDTATPGTYQWADSETVDYTNWSAGEPLAEFGYMAASGQWSTSDADTFGYVCEGGLPAVPALVGYWHLDDGVGIFGADASGNGLTAQLLGAYGWVASTLGAALPGTPATGTAVSFASSGRAQLVAPYAWTDSITIEAWIETLGAGAADESYRLALIDASTGVSAWELDFTNVFEGAAALTSDCSTCGGATSANVTAAAGWSHIAVTCDGTTIRVFFEGTEIATGTHSGSLGTGPFAFEFGDGPILTDEVLLWSIALDPTIIADHADTGDVDEGLPLPVLSDIQPRSIGVGQTQVLALTGDNFTTEMTVDLGPGIVVDQVVVTSAGAATVTATADGAAALGFRTPRTLTEYGIAGLPKTFLVYGLHGVAPSVVEVGLSNQVVELFGYGLDSADTFDFGPGITLNSQLCSSSRRCVFSLDVSGGLALGSRDVTATDAAGSVGLLAGVLTVGGPNAIVWTTRADFEASNDTHIDLQTIDGSAILATDSGARTCELDSGLCADMIRVAGAGNQAISFTGSMDVLGFGGGYVGFPLPSGEFQLQTEISLSNAGSEQLELFGVGAAQGFLAGQSLCAGADHAGVYVDDSDDTFIYRASGGVCEYWDESQALWGATPVASGAYPASAAIELRVCESGAPGIEYALVVRDLVGASDLAAACDIQAPTDVAYLGTRSEQDFAGHPQFGLFSVHNVDIFDPNALRGDFDTALLDAGFTASVGANGSATSGAAGGTALEIVMDAAAPTFVHASPPLVAGSTVRVRARVVSVAGGPNWAPLIGVAASSAGSAVPTTDVSFLYSGESGTKLAWYEYDSNTLAGSWYDGTQWVGSSASIPGSEAPYGDYIDIVLHYDGTTIEAQVFDLTGVLIATVPLVVGSAIADPVIIVGSSIAQSSSGNNAAGTIEVDSIAVRGSMTGPGYENSGVLTVDPYDAGGPINFGSMGIGASIPTGTGVSLQVRAGATLNDVLAAPFVGPDGTTNSVFLGGESLGTAFDGNRFIQWRAVFAALDQTETPELLDVIILIAEIPTILSVNPGWGNPGETLNVVIQGTAFDSSSLVDFGAGIVVNGVTVDSSGQLTVNVTVDGGQSPGMRDVTVSTTAGSATLVDGFAVAGAQLVSPASGEQNSTGLPFQITGIGFEQPISVDFGPGVSVASLVFVDSGSLTGTVDIAANAPLGPRDVTVTSNGFLSTLPDAFDVLAPAGCPACDILTLASVNPAVLDRDMPNTLALAGTGFGAQMSLDGGTYLQIADFVVLSDTQATVIITVINDPPVAANHTLTLTRQAQQATADVDVLDIGSTNHPQIPAGTTAALLATGDGFDNGTPPAIALSDPSLGTSLTSYDNNNFELSVTVPSTAPLGTRDVSIQVGGADSFFAGALTVVGDSENSLPLLAGLSPNVGIRGNSYSVTASGQNFTLDMTLDCGVGIVITDVTPVSSTQATFTMTIAAGANGGPRTCSVTTEFGLASLPNAFLVLTGPCDGVVCNDSPSPCHVPVGTCNETNGQCEYAQKAPGDACDDGVACTVGDTCDAAGNCGTPSNVECNDGLPCTIDICDAELGCSNTPEDAFCDPSDCPVGGDLNGNGVVNVADLVCAINVILSEFGEQPACLKGVPAFADMNCSENITVSDVQLLIAIALLDALPPQIDRNVNVCHDACEVPSCGDGLCNGATGGKEDCLLCPEDCGGCDTGACDELHSGAGCNDVDVQECVCDSLYLCCGEPYDWGQSCVDEAAFCP